MAATFAALALSACGGGKDADTASGAGTDTATQASTDTATATENTADQPADAVASTDGEETETAAASTETTTQTVASTPTEVVQAVTVADGNSNVSYNFESSFAKLAPGWWINWWGNGTVNWTASRETRAGYMHGGVASQRLSIVSVPAGGGAHMVFSYGFLKDTSYTSSVWLRADTSTEVDVLMRRDASPWNVVARKRVTVGTTWQQVQLTGTYTFSEAGSLRIVPITVGSTIYIDDMSITKATTTTPTAQAPGGIVLPAAGTAGEQLVTFATSTMDETTYSRFAPGWYYNAFAGTATGEFLASRESRAGYTHSGAGSQKFQVINKYGGEVHLTSTRTFVKGKTYRATLWLRADTATPVKVFMRRDEHPWDAFASKTVTVGTAWQQVVIEGGYVGTAAGSLRLTTVNATGTFWVDDVKIEEVIKNDMAPFSTTTIPDTLFGMHVNRLGAHFNWPGMNTRIIRLHNTGTTWRDLEPTNNAWNWDSGPGKRLDMYVDYAMTKEPGAQLVYTMGMTPLWASTTPTVSSLYGLGASGAPKSMDDWRDYVRTLALRYKGKIRYWELWNEPDFKQHWVGTNAQLVEMARIAAEELHAADPANKLVGPGFTAGQGMSALDALLTAGLGNHVDAIGYHFYYSTNPEVVGAQIDNVRGLMKAHGVDQKPLWITEGAFICDSLLADCTTALPSAAQQRSVNARAMFMMATRGVANFNFYLFESTDAYRKLVQSDYATLTEEGKAYGEARGWLRGARIVDAYRVDDKVYVLRMNRGTENYVVLWSTQAAGTLVNLPSAWTVARSRSVLGVEAAIPSTRQLTLGLEPVLLKP